MVVTIQFWKTHHAVHVSFARPVSFGHLPEAPSIMNCISLPETEPLLIFFLNSPGGGIPAYQGKILPGTFPGTFPLAN
jgi:hypothetical protein